MCTNAIYGFINSLLKILHDEKPDYIAVVFDSPQPTFRHKLFEEYKATREKMPDEMSAQMPYIFKVLELMQIPTIVKPGFEADDIIGTLAKRAEQKDIDTYIVSGDKDFMQLVSDRVKIYDSTKTQEPLILDREGVEEKFGVPPELVVDALALMGDSSDNVPGARGIGEKTAISLLKKYGSLQGVLQNASKERNKRSREGLLSSIDQILLSEKLVRIDTALKLDHSPEELRPGSADVESLLELFDELEFDTLRKRLILPSTDDWHTYRIVKTEKELGELVEKLRGAEEFAFDLETTSTDPMRAEIVGLSFCWKEREAWYVPAMPDRKLPRGSIFDQDRTQLKAVLEALRPVLEDESIRKGGQNIKYDIVVLANYGIEVKGIEFDTMVASYLLDPSSRQHNLDSISLKHLGIQKTPTSALIGKGKKQISMKDVQLDIIADYACEDADMTFRLHHILSGELRKKKLDELYERLEIPLVPVLARMEYRGVKLDTGLLRRLSEEVSSQVDALADEIYKLAGMSFNINSTQQLGKVLFEKMEIHRDFKGFRPRKTKTGYATDQSTLDALSSHPIVSKILRYRTLTKLKGTYLDALPALVNPKTGRLHTSFNQTITATGRLSSSDPNLQNIPIRDEIGRQIRRAFIPPDDDRILLSADYSQIELRILAHISGDEELREAFRRGEDIHTLTASRVFSVPTSEVTRELRDRCKAINYGIIYGMGPQRLSKEANISVEEARKFIGAYFNAYPKVKDYIDRSIQTAREEGYVTTILGRRRYIPEIHSSNRGVQVNAEHAAVNTPIQGSAADLIKLAMVRIDRKLREQFPDSYMVLQVHDELVFDVPISSTDALESMIKRLMEGALELEVPIVVDVKRGSNWLEAH